MMCVDTITRPPNDKAVNAQLSTTLKTALPLSGGAAGVNVKCLIILRREPAPVLLMQQLVLHPNS
jgi:hypothetical protein